MTYFVGGFIVGVMGFAYAIASIRQGWFFRFAIGLVIAGVGMKLAIR
jgi:hypothetical protein